MKFQYISDLHLQKGNHPSITSEAPYLILAGNLGFPFKNHYIEFLEQVSSQFEKIFLVMGNIEYYGNSFASVRRRIGEIITRFKNIIFLDNTVYDVADNISIYGTTLWSDLQGDMEAFRFCLEDYCNIPAFAPEHSKNLHRIARKTFQTFLDRYPPSHKWIVISHFIPHKTLLDPKLQDHPMGTAHGSDVEEFMHQNVVAVVYGHSETATATSKYYTNPLVDPNASCSATFEVEA